MAGQTSSAQEVGESERAPTGPVRALSPLIYGPQGPQLDMVVVGGGSIGTGIARDAALRGLSVLLLEKDDLGAGASGSASGLIQGFAGCCGALALPLPPAGDAPCLQRIARHLVQRIPLLVPFLDRRRPSPLGRALFRSRAAAASPAKAERPRLLDTAEVRRLLPGLAAPTAGGVCGALWTIRAGRLVAACAVSAAEAGATILPGHRLEELLTTATGRVYGVRARDPSTGLVREWTTAVVVNAAGAWAAQVAALAGQPLRLGQQKGVRLFTASPLGSQGLAVPAIDGHPVLLLPGGQTTSIGASFSPYFGDADDLAVGDQEIEYLLQAAELVDQRIRLVPLVGTTVGLRAALLGNGAAPTLGSFAHQIIDHGLTGASGLISVLGGSLAAHRAIAEQVVDLVCQRLRRTEPCRTGKLPLPGAERQIHVPLLAASSGLPEGLVHLLATRQGDRARQVLAASPGDREIVCRCCGVGAAEVRYVVRHEWVRDLAALRRRTGLGEGPCGGALCATRGAQLIGLELGLSPRAVRALVEDDARRRFRVQAPVAGGPAASALARNRMLSLAGRDVEDLP